MLTGQNSDEMTARARIRAVILSEPVDRVPFIPFFLSFLAVDSGVTLCEFFTDPDLAFRAAVTAMKKYPWANIRPAYDWADHGAWEFGGTLEWPAASERMTPFTPEPLLSRPEQVAQLPEPDPGDTEWFRLLGRFNQICIQNGFTAQLPSTSILSPLGSILGGANLMKWIVKYPDAVHCLARKVTRFNLKLAKSIVDQYGARNCSVTTQLPLESNTVISPETFEKVCLPYIAEMHGFYAEVGVRATVIHLCGDHGSNLKYWKNIPVPERTIFSIGDDMDLEETGNCLGKKYILAGNISTTVLQVGSREEVKAETERCLNQAKGRPGGFILMPACEWPPSAPAENLQAVREAVMEHGFY